MEPCRGPPYVVRPPRRRLEERLPRGAGYRRLGAGDRVGLSSPAPSLGNRQHATARLGLPIAQVGPLDDATASLPAHDELLPARRTAARLPPRSAADRPARRVAAEHRRRAPLRVRGAALLRHAGRLPRRPRRATWLRPDRAERSLLCTGLCPRSGARPPRPA